MTATWIRTSTVALLGAALALQTACAQAPGAAAKKVLRVAFPVAETGFDPAKINDLYSRTITPHIFEGLYQYDHLARPAKIKPLTAAAMPEVSADFRTWTVKLRPGIYFAADPAFKGPTVAKFGARRYCRLRLFMKRPLDPANKSPIVAGMLETKYHRPERSCATDALESKQPFDYDTRDRRPARAGPLHDPVQARASRDPRFLETLADRRPVRCGGARGGRGLRRRDHGPPGGHRAIQAGAVAAQFADRARAQPRLPRGAATTPSRRRTTPRARRCWPSSRAARCRWSTASRSRSSRRAQPRWLAFLNGQHRLAGGADRIRQPGRAQRQARAEPGQARHPDAYRQVQSDSRRYTYFNMDDPVVGGYTPDKVALRRAISLGIDIDREIRIIRRGQAIPAQARCCRTPPATTRRSRAR